MAYNDYYKKKHQRLKEDEDKLLSVFKKKQPKNVDDDLINEITFINNNLFKESELQNYYKMAKSFNYDLSLKITNWIDKLYNLVKE